MPASIRIIKIVKDAMGGEAYTVEFECIADEAKDLLIELVKSPYGQRAIELLNRAEFLPEEKHKTQEEIKTEAERETREREAYEKTLKERGRREMMYEVLRKMRELYGDEFVKKFEDALAGKEEDKKKEEGEREVEIIHLDEGREPE